MKINKKLLWIYILSGAIYFTQGIEGLPSLSLFFYMKETLHFTPEKIMYLSSIISLAWLVKPLIGYIVDNYLTKKAWIISSLIGSVIISGWLGFSSWMPVILIIVMASMASWNAAVRDVSVDGIMCVEGKKTNSCDRIQAIQWTSITIASILVSLAGGYIADHFNYKIAYLSLVPIYLIILGIVSKYKNKSKKQYINHDLNKETLPSCGRCINRTKCEFHNINLCSNYKKEKVRILETICSYRELINNKKFIYTCLFIFLYNFAPGFGTPLMFIERDVFKWSGTFMGIMGAIISALGIIGSVLYFKFGRKINIEKCLFWSVFIGALNTLCYLYFTPISAIIYGTIFSVIGMFIFLNIMTFMAQSSIPGKEATSFALLCSVNNLSGTCSTLVGAWLYPLIGLKYLIIVSACASFICIPLIRKLEIK